MTPLVISPGYPPATGGVETHVAELSRRVAAAGADVVVWTHRPAGASRVDTLDGVRVERFNHVGPSHLSLAPSLLIHGRRHASGIDLVHAHSYHSTAALAALSVPSRVPVIFTPHYHGGGHSPLASLLHRPYRLLGQRIFARADVIVAVSTAERDLICQHFPELAPRIRVIHNAADVTDIHAALPWPEQPPTLLILGRQEPYKLVEAAIAAFDQLDHPGQLVILGDGSSHRSITDAARTARRGNDIRVLGQVSDVDRRRWLRTARGVISLSEHEAFGIVGVEGVAGGGRAVLSDIAAHREVESLLPVGTVSVVDASRGASLVDALTRTLDTPTAEPRAVRSWDDAAREHLALYRELTSHPRT